MKYLITMFCVVLSCFAQEAAQSMPARRAFERGMAAYNNKKYTEAFPDLKEAAAAGIVDAYEPLLDLYVEGEYDGSGKGNYEEAYSLVILGWNYYLKDKSKYKELTNILMFHELPLNFLIGNYSEVIRLVTKGFMKGKSINPVLMNQIAASYLKIGNMKKAMEWLNKAIKEAKLKNNKFSLSNSNAILSKIAFDNREYDKSLELSKDAAEIGNPLASYVYGASLIKTKRNPKVGKDYVKYAAEPTSGLFEINCFDAEIERYWNSIKDISY